MFAYWVVEALVKNLFVGNDKAKEEVSKPKFTPIWSSLSVYFKYPLKILYDSEGAAWSCINVL